MTNRMTGCRRSALVAAALFGVLLLDPIANVTPASAQRSPEAEQACTPDVMRLCGDFIPNVGPIVACMRRKHLQLSAECRRYFKPRPVGRAHR